MYNWTAISAERNITNKTISHISITWNNRTGLNTNNLSNDIKKIVIYYSSYIMYYCVVKYMSWDVFMFGYREPNRRRLICMVDYKTHNINPTHTLRKVSSANVVVLEYSIVLGRTPRLPDYVAWWWSLHNLVYALLICAGIVPCLLWMVDFRVRRCDS